MQVMQMKMIGESVRDVDGEDRSQGQAKPSQPVEDNQRRLQRCLIPNRKFDLDGRTAFRNHDDRRG
jgi:hypothetical protein